MMHYMTEVAKNDRVQLYAARSLLLLGLYFAADTTTIDDEPSTKENARVMACAEKLGTEPRPVTGNDMPKECVDYAVDFEQTTTIDSTQSLAAGLRTVLPASDSFERDHIKGPEYDEQVRQRYMYNSLGLVAAGGVLYGVRFIRRGLQEDDVFRRIEEYANNHE